MASDQAIKLAANRPEVWYRRGHILAWLGKFTEALAAYEHAVNLDPSNSERWRSKGNVLSWIGRHVEAIEAYEQAISTDPTNNIAWDGMAYSLVKLGRYDDALTACDQAIRLAPDVPINYENRGHARLNLGRLCDAIDDFNIAIQLRNNSPGAFEGLAEAFLRQDNWNEAQRALAQRFRLPSRKSNFFSWHLPAFIASLFLTTIADPNVRNHRLQSLLKTIREAQDHRDQEQSGEASGVDEAKIYRQDVFTLFGNALVRSLQHATYSQATAEALNGWGEAWRAAGELHPELAVTVRLFGVGLQYVRTKDDRVLLDLVQDERVILRELFGLDEANE